MGTRLGMSNSAMTPRLDASWTWTINDLIATHASRYLLTESPMSPSVWCGPKARASSSLAASASFSADSPSITGSVPADEMSWIDGIA